MYISDDHLGLGRCLTSAVQENQYWPLHLGITRVLGPDVEFQAVLRRGVVVQGCKILPHTQARRLGEVGKGAHWRFVCQTVRRLSMSVSDI
jgi:hypothetical protein